MNPAGVIIAGGKSSRLGGGPKCLREVGGRSILARIVSRISPQAGIVAVNTGDAAVGEAAAGLPLIPDRKRGIGTPLAGIHAALSWARDIGADRVLTVPSDTPFLPADLVERLAAAGAPAAIAASGGQPHYLTGLWPVPLLAAIEDAIERRGLFRVRDWADAAGAASVNWPVEPFDPFFNVNTVQSLAEAADLAARFET